MVRKRTKTARLRDKMSERVTKFDGLGDIMSKGEARFGKGNQHVDNCIGNKCSCVQLGYAIDVIAMQKVICAYTEYQCVYASKIIITMWRWHCICLALCFQLEFKFRK